MWNAEIVSQCDSELISQPEFSWILYFYFIHTSWPLIGHETCRDIVFRVFPLISGVQCRVTPLDGAVSISHTAWRTDDAQAWPAISEGLWNNLKAASSKSTNKCLNERKKKTITRVWFWSYESFRQPVLREERCQVLAKEVQSGLKPGLKIGFTSTAVWQRLPNRHSNSTFPAVPWLIFHVCTPSSLNVPGNVSQQKDS